MDVSRNGAWHTRPLSTESTESKRVVNPVCADVVWLSVACLVKIPELIVVIAGPVRVAIEAVPNVVTHVTPKVLVTVSDDWVPLHPTERMVPLPFVDKAIPSAGILVFMMLFARSWICPEPVAAVIGA